MHPDPFKDMNHTIIHRQSLLFRVFIAMLFFGLTNGCKPDENVSTDPTENRSTGCRLTSRIISLSSPDILTSNWVYDANGMLIQQTNPSTVGSYPTRVDLHYDTNGYLLTTTQIHTYSGIGGFSSDTLVTNYAYANGRLSKEVSGSRIISYEYSLSGELTKVVNNSGPYVDTEIDVFSAGKLMDHIVVNYESKAEVRPYQIDNGRIIREYVGDHRYYTGYQYDDQGRPTKIERVDGTTVTEYYTYSYTDGKAYFDAIPLPKGWPMVTRKKFIYDALLFGSSVMPVGLPTKWVRYSTTRIGSTELFKNIVKEYTHVKNEQGYPLRSDYTTTVYTSFNEIVGTPSRITETYTYEGCQ